MSAGKFAEQRIFKQRAREAKDGELRRKLTENNLLAGHGASAMRVESKRRLRENAEEMKESYLDYQFVKGEQDKARRNEVAHFEEYLADELARRKAQSHREDMEKRRICDGSEELRALKERLHMAKVNKERAQQLLEIEVRKEKDRFREHKIDEYMENERLEHQELEHRLGIEKAKQRERVKHINQQQITAKEAQRDDAMQEYLKEKAQVEELVERIAQEDAEESAARHQKQVESREMLQQFMREQKARQQAMEQAEIDENNAIEQYAADKRAREERLAEERAEAEREKIRILNKQLGVMAAKNKEAEELEQLRNDLHLEELEAESRRIEEMKMRKKLEDKEEMKNAYVFQMRMKEDKARKEKEEEEDLRQQLLAKFAEDDRLEQMSDQRRRMKVEQHKRDAEKMMQIRRDKYDQSRQQERDQEAELRGLEAKRQVVIEAERRRLLDEYGKDLKEFLPKGTLETKEDHQQLFGKT